MARRLTGSGNDDLGQMSAWLVFTALGFYPVTPASLQYVIGRPFVDRAVLALPNRRRLTVTAAGLGAGRPYVGRVMLNGVAVPRAYLRHDEIVAGGALRFTIQAAPNTAWATRPADRPCSTGTTP